MTPDVLVAGNTPDQDESDEEDDGSTTTPAPPAKPTVTVDDQLSKALDLLKAKA